MASILKRKNNFLRQFALIVIIAMILWLLPLGSLFAQGTATASVGTPLAEDDLDGAVISTTLTDETFDDSIIDPINIRIFPTIKPMDTSFNILLLLYDGSTFSIIFSCLFPAKRKI